MPRSWRLPTSGRHELRPASRALPTIEAGSHKGRQMMNDFAGIDLEKQVHHIVAYVEPHETPGQQDQRGRSPRMLLLVQGSFDQRGSSSSSTITAESSRTTRAGSCSCILTPKSRWRVGLPGPDLIAIGQVDLVRRAMDRARDGARGAEDITSNDEMMNLIKRQCRQHGMGGRPLRRDAPPHAAAQRLLGAGAARAAGLDESARERRHAGHDPRGNRRPGGGRSAARYRPRVRVACAPAGRRASPASRTR